MFLHFVPVDGVEYFPGICWWDTYVFMFLCFQKTSLYTPSKYLAESGKIHARATQFERDSNLGNQGRNHVGIISRANSSP